MVRDWKFGDFWAFGQLFIQAIKSKTLFFTLTTSYCQFTLIIHCKLSIFLSIMVTKDNVVKDKSFGFAIKVVKLYKHLTEMRQEYVMSKQLLRSGTAIGAMVREADQAESRKDFVHKLAISLKEASETEYWLDLLHQTDFIEERIYMEVKENLKELLRLLTAIIKTSKMKN